MTYGSAVVRRAGELADSGASISSIAGELGLSRSAVRDWINHGPESVATRRQAIGDRGPDGACVACPVRCSLDVAAYSYLLGLYLGDGCLALHPRRVYRLRIFCCDAYPQLMDLCVSAIAAVRPTNVVGRARHIGCTEIYSLSKHWICLFPQHGIGRKHKRRIALERWQYEIVETEPRMFLRGLVHSDGCRVMNRVHVHGRWYAYPRYFFSNESDDIRFLFGYGCDLIGVEWRHNRRNSISVARRESVALLDEFIGPKS